MLDESARLRRTSAMGWHESVDRLRRAAPSGKRLNERAECEIVADQQFGHEADPEARIAARTACELFVRKLLATSIAARAPPGPSNIQRPEASHPK